MKYLIANENGDWWELDTEGDAGNTLFIIETQKLEHILIDEDDRLSSKESIYGLDKLEKDIWTHGRPVNIEQLV